MNIATNLEKAAFHFPEHIAIFDRDRKITFQAFNRESSRIAAALAAAGIQPGTHVALCAPNSYAWLAFYFGVIKAGAVAVTFSYLLAKPELAQTISEGYLNNPEETGNAFRGDWFRSGDIGLIDDDGYLYIVDRLKDLIITGGENVYPREIEELLYARPEVQECAVIGLPDREYGERVMAVIVPYKNQKIDTAAIRSYLREQLAGFKVPKGFICLDDELPKNNAGKILKREIRLKYQGLPQR